MAMAKHGYAVIIGDVIPIEGIILGSVGGNFFGFNMEKRVKSLYAVGFDENHTMVLFFLLISFSLKNVSIKVLKEEFYKRNE